MHCGDNHSHMLSGADHGGVGDGGNRMTEEELRKATYLVRDVVSALKVARREFPKCKKLVPSATKVHRLRAEIVNLLEALEAKNAD